MKNVDLTKRSFVLVLLASLVLILVLAGLIESKKLEQKNSEGNVTLLIESVGKTTTVKTTIGGYIKCIDDVCVYSDYNWVFYVNNKSVSLSANSYRTKAGDTIKFEFRKRNVGEER